MRKGIYKDNKTNTWYIHTKKRGKNITIRGYQSKAEADKDYDFAIEKWLNDHNFVLDDNSYKGLVNEYLNYRSKILRQESLRKDITQFKYFDVIFKHDKTKNIFEHTRLKVVYDDIIANKTFSTQKKNLLSTTFKDFAKYCFMTNRITKSTFDYVILTFLPIKANSQDKKDKRYIPISHFKALSSHIIKNNDYLFNLAISMLYFGGLRISELLGLLNDDIDLENKKIYVRRQLLTNGDITTTLKTKNSYRYIPINDLLFENLLKNNKNSKNIDGKSVYNRVFPYSHTSFKRKLTNYEQEANIPNYACHEFRHTFCTNLASKITNTSEVVYCSKVAGHTPSMFLNTYVKSLDDELSKKFF